MTFKDQDSFRYGPERFFYDSRLPGFGIKSTCSTSFRRLGTRDALTRMQLFGSICAAYVRPRPGRTYTGVHKHGGPITDDLREPNGQAQRRRACDSST